MSRRPGPGVGGVALRSGGVSLASSFFHIMLMRKSNHFHDVIVSGAET